MNCNSVGSVEGAVPPAPVSITIVPLYVLVLSTSYPKVIPKFGEIPVAVEQSTVDVKQVIKPSKPLGQGDNGVTVPIEPMGRYGA